MTFAGIICEYNPFHSGHMAHIEKTREFLGDATYIICVMSGNYVQRGEPAIYEKHARALSALKGGADLVIELPVIWSSSSAEKFASAGVYILSSLGIPVTLSFGSECGDLSLLQRIEECLSSDMMKETLDSYLRKGMSYASARQEAAFDLIGPDASVLQKPNNILGMEYLKAIRKSGAGEITPYTVRRIFTEHDGPEEGGLAPASAVRKILKEGGDAGRYLPPECAGIFEDEKKVGRAPIDYSSFERAVLLRLRTMSDQEYAGLPDATEGLQNRLMQAGRSAATYNEILDTVKTKRYALSRIRRMLLCSLLGITSDMQSGMPPYIRPLAFNRRGREILHIIRGTARLPIISRPSDALHPGGDAERVFRAEIMATDIYSLFYPEEKCRTGGQELRINPIYAEY